MSIIIPRRSLLLGGGALALAPTVTFAASDLGKPAPAFSATDSNGKTWSLDALKGKVVVLETTNRDCPYVGKHYSAGNMQAQQREAATKGVVWLTVAASAPGTSPYFFLSWALKKAGLKLGDVKIATLEPAPAANAFVAGNAGLDAAVTYEPYLSQVRKNPNVGKIIVDSLSQPIVFDSFGCTPKFIKENPKAVKALVDSYFQALDMIAADKTKAFTIMGADVKQTAQQFEESQSMLKWADRAANAKFFNGEIQAFNKDAAALLLETGVIKKVPANMDSLFDTSFLK